MVPSPDLPTPVPAGAGAGGGRGAPDPKASPPPHDDDGGDKGGDRGGGLFQPRRRYGFDKRVVRKVIEKRFRIYEERDALPGLDQAVLVAFFILAEREEVDAAFPSLQADLRAVDPLIQATLREEGGETIIVVTRRSEETRKVDPRLAMILMFATLVMLTLAGSLAWGAYENARLATTGSYFAPMIDPDFLALGAVSFAAPFAFVFVVQELARRIVAKRHGVSLGPSYWIPVPPIVFVLAIGTFGTVLHNRGPFPDKRSMFDIAAAGPIAGFLAALPIVALGLMLTASGAVAVPDRGAMHLEIVAPDGTTWTEGEGGLLDPFEREAPPEDEAFRAHNVTVTATLQVAGREYGDTGWVARAVGEGATGRTVSMRIEAMGRSDDGSVTPLDSVSRDMPANGSTELGFGLLSNTSTLLVVMEFQVEDQISVELGLPLAYRAVQWGMGEGDDALMHPVAMAGWAILLVIGITLLPTGRFDGGAVARAALGERMVIVSWGALVGVAVLWFFYQGWLYLVLTVLLFMGARHPAALNERTELDAKRWVLLVLLVVLFVVSFVPIPAYLPGRGF